jgi:hypothetical protein
MPAFFFGVQTPLGIGEMRHFLLAHRTTKTKGSIKLRFRLRDGRDVQLFHKSDIDADLQDLTRFDNTTCKPKNGSKVYNVVLAGEIDREVAIMNDAYTRMLEKGLDLTSEVFERTIEEIKHPIEEVRSAEELLSVRFRRYADEALRDRIIGQARYDHFITVSGKLERYLIIKGITRTVPSEVTPDFLMDFRNFLFDEYTYVPKHKLLYKKLNKRSLPTERLSLNTVATQMKIVQTFFNTLEQNDEIVKSPFRKLGKERQNAVVKTLYDDPIFLRAEEFKLVRTAELPEKLRPTRDAFVVLCALGCRISDFQAMSMANISVSDEGIPYVHYLPQKTAGTQDTNKEVQTPLVRFAFDIIKRTNFDFPIIRNVYGKAGFNTLIKWVIEQSGVDRTVPIYNEELRKNEYVPIFTQGSSKLGRKTFVDMMAKVQVNKYAAGLHREGSNAVDRYTNLELRDRFALMNAAFDQKAYKVDKDLKIVRK